MILNLKSEIVEGLELVAAAHGLTIEAYLSSIVEEHKAVAPVEGLSSNEGSGMIVEDGLLIYGAGSAVSPEVIDDAIRRSREERSRHVAGRI
jgi:hypothetical protein